MLGYAARMKRTCLVVGCGYVGRRLVAGLPAHWRAVALVRSAVSAAGLRARGIEAIAADLDAADPLPDASAVADDGALVYLAPPPHAGTTDPRLARVLAALGDARPAALVYMSTTGVYGDAGGGSVDESSPVAPAADRARRRVAAEQMARLWCETHGVRTVVLRVPGIYGPGRLPLERLQSGEPALAPEDSGPGNRIHVDDLVAACMAALERPVSGVFNVGDGDHSSTTAFLQTTAALADLPPPLLVSLTEARGRISPGLLSYLVESRRVDTHRMREELGVVPRYASHADGIAASLSEMRAQGR